MAGCVNGYRAILPGLGHAVSSVCRLGKGCGVVQRFLNATPTLFSNITDQSCTESTEWIFILPADTFIDQDSDDAIHLSAYLASGENLPQWMTFDSRNRQFSGTPNPGDIGHYDILVTATDKSGARSQDEFSLTVSRLNHTPTVGLPIQDSRIYSDIDFQYSIPAECFIDPDIGTGDWLGYDVKLAHDLPLPAWLNFDPASRTFSGKPALGDIGFLDVLVTVTDSSGTSASSHFNINIGRRISATKWSDHVIGSNGNDEISGGAGADLLDGGMGDDEFLIRGSQIGADVVRGGDGVDVVLGSDTDDTIKLSQYGGVDSVEHINGGAGYNRIITGAWAAKLDFSATELVNIARIEGGAGNETLIGSQGDDVIMGGGGPDVLRGEGGNDVFLVEGDSGSDVVSGGAGLDELRGATDDDILRLSNFYGDDTVERIDGGTGMNRIVGGAWAARLDFSATELVNITRIEGSAGNNVITGSAGDDVLAGLGGPDQISGGQGNDVYEFNRGDGVDTWIETDATAGNEDIARFGLEVLYDQIWFQRKGNNLEAQILGTTDKAIVKDWYLGEAHRLERFETADGHALLNNQLDQLIQAMAAFNPPPPGQSSLPDNYRQALEPVLAASWG